MTNKKITLKDILYDLAVEIRELKEENCENSGWNWYNNFTEKINDLAMPRVSYPKK